MNSRVSNVDGIPVQFAEAAKKWCLDHYVDPNELVPFDNGSMAYTRRPRWIGKAFEFIALVETIEFLKENRCL